MVNKEKNFTEEDYLILCHYSDQLLKERETSLVCTSSSCLHIIREHPLFLAKYKEFLNNNFVNYTKKVLLIALGWTYNFYRSLFSGKWLWKSNSSDTDTTDFLFISHMLNEDYGENHTDFYFDKIPHLLQIDGHNTAVALINHTKFEKPTFFKRLVSDGVKYFLLKKHLSLAYEFKFFRNIVKEMIQLNELSRKAIDPIYKSIIKSASLDIFSRNSVHSLRLYTQIKHLVKELRPKVMVITYEGHAWERLVMAAARDSFPEIICIGYQHAVIFRLQHSIRQSLSHRFNPDILYCSGIVGKNQLENANSLSSIPKLLLGSNRSIDQSITLTETAFLKLSSDTSVSCLVIPEGDVNECKLLFEFSLECAKKMPEATFLWRMHPLVNFQMLARLNKRLSHLPENITLSSGSLDHDIAQCNFALYRGTTAIIKAVGNGLIPIYLAKPNEMSIDTLYEVNNPEQYVYTPEDFINEVKLKKSWKDFSKVKDYCLNMFQPLDYSVLKQQLIANQLN